MRIPVFGASVERGYWDFRGGWVHRLQEDLDRYRWEQDEDYSIYNLGISGDTSRDVLSRVEGEISARNNEEELAIILRVTGTNDSQLELNTQENLIAPREYRLNMEKIIEKCRTFTERIYLVGDVPIAEEEVDPIPWKPTHSYREEEILKYRRQLEEIVEEEKLEFVDLRSRIHEEKWKEECMKDGVHPNEKGHKRIHRIMKEELKSMGLLPTEL